MSILPQYKIGDCSIDGCGLTETQGRKVGKKFICANHYSDIKRKEQIAKANVRQSVRGLVKYERQEGILDNTQELILDLDRVVSRYVRLAAMGKDHKCDCYTCGVRKEWTKMQAGHFISRKHLSLRWNTTYNIKVQCNDCNVCKHGNLEVYIENLEKEQPGIVEYLKEQSRQVENTTRTELKILLFDFQQKLKLVETKLK